MVPHKYGKSEKKKHCIQYKYQRSIEQEQQGIRKK